MSLLEPLAQPAWQRLALSLLHFVWQGTLIAALVGVAMSLFGLRRPHARYAACLVAFAAMAACPLVTFLLTNPPAPIGSVTEPPPAPIPKPAALLADSLPRPEERSFEEPARTAETPAEPHGAEVSSQPRARSLQARLRTSLHAAQPWIVLGWMTGVLMLSTRLVLGAAGVARLKRRLQPITDYLLSDRLCQRMGIRRLPRLAGSGDICEAMAIGLFRPVVVLPLAWLTELPPEALEAIVAHELAHIRRWDLPVNLFQRVLETLLFYHPAVWWLSRRLRTEREMCCDELAVAATQRPAAYAMALETVARSQHDRSDVLLGAAISASKMNLLHRVRHVLGLGPVDGGIARWPSALVAILIPVALAFGVHGKPAGSAAQPNPADQPDSELPDVTPQELAERMREAWRAYERGELEAEFVEERNANAFPSDAEPVLRKYPGRLRYASDGTRWRAEYDAMRLGRPGVLYPYRWSAGFDGTSHWRWDRSAGEFVIGDLSFEATTLQPLEVFCASAGFATHGILNLGERTEITQRTVDGFRCYVLAWTAPDGNYRGEEVVSPRQSCLVIRRKAL